MKRLSWGRLMAGAVLAAAMGCTDDPTAALRSGARRLSMSASSLTVNVLDSVAVNVTVRDNQGNPLPTAATATSSAPTIVSVSTSSGAPLPQTKFFVKGLLFGQAFVRVTDSEGATDSIRVFAYPASVQVTGAPPDSLASGSSATLTATARSAGSPPQPVANVTPISWVSDDATSVSVTTPGSTSTALGRTPGVATITVTVPGGANTAVPIRVYAAPFNGSLSANNGNPGDVITISSNASGPTYDADAAATLGGHALMTTGTGSAASFQVAIPPVGPAGAKRLEVINIGPNQFAQQVTFTLNSASLDDQYEATNNNPVTAPVIGASGDYFITLHGGCDTPPGGIPSAPSDDCDDFFTITNAGASPLPVDVEAEWAEGGDVDILWCDSPCGAFVGNFSGATVNNPEHSAVSIPAGTTWRLYMNLFDGLGEVFNFVRVRVTIG